LLCGRVALECISVSPLNMFCSSTLAANRCKGHSWQTPDNMRIVLSLHRCLHMPSADCCRPDSGKLPQRCGRAGASACQPGGQAARLLSPDGRAGPAGSLIGLQPLSVLRVQLCSATPVTGQSSPASAA
jgi:hypothetical protein